MLTPAASAGIPTVQRYALNGSDQRARDVILTVVPGLKLPTNQLFKVDPAPGAKYLVETDPRFTNYQTFLGSDYFQQQLQLDPSRLAKRYGDGFEEQRLIDDQVLALTGRRYLSGYSSTEAEYLGLMNAGVAFAQAYQLTPGMSLSAEQMALLTTDIVWLTTQTVTLADGSTTQALIPQVYLRQVRGQGQEQGQGQGSDLSPSGALMAGSTLLVKTPGQLVNSASLSADSLAVDAADITNSGSITAQRSAYLRASNDLTSTGAIMAGAGAGAGAGTVSLTAGRDIVLQTRTLTSTDSTTTANATSTSSRTHVDRIATVQAGAELLINAGRDLDVQGASLSAGGELQATAGRDIRISAVQGSYQIDVKTLGGASTQGRTGYISQAATTSQASNLSATNITLTAGTDASQATGDATTSHGNLSITGSDLTASRNISLQGNNVSIEAAKSSQSADIQTVQRRAYNRGAQSDETLVGGNLSAGGNLSVTATGNGTAGQGDITLKGANLQAGVTPGSQATLIANNNLNVLDATTAHTSAQENYHLDKGLITSTDTTASSQSTSSRSTSSRISAGGTTALVAGTDLGIQGGNIAGDQGLLLSAGRNLIAMESRSTTDSTSTQNIHQGGLAGSFMGVPLPGSTRDRTSATGHTESVNATRLTSSAGAVRIVSNGTTALQGVQTQAAQGISVQGGEVITAGAVGVDNASTEHATRGDHIGMTGVEDLGKGLGAHRKDTTVDQTTGLVRTTLDGGSQGVSITATGQNGASGDLTLAGTTITAPSVKLDAANNLNLNIQLTPQLTSRSSEGGDVGWQKLSGKGQSSEAVAYNEINTAKLSTIAKAVNLQAVQPPPPQADPPLGAKGAAASTSPPSPSSPPLSPAQQLQATVETLQTQPGMAWMGQLQNDPNLKGKVNLAGVSQAVQNWDYDHLGLTKEGAAVVAVVVAYFTAGAASGIAASAGDAAAVSAGEGVAMSGGGAFLTTTGATISTVVGGATAAGVSALASEAAVALLNNKGDVGKALHELGSSANVKDLVSAVLTGGVLAGLNLNPTGGPTQGAGAAEFTQQLGQNLQAAAAKAVINTAIYGTSLEDNLKAGLKGALIDTAAAQTANAIGDQNFDTFANKVAHAVAGCAAGAATTGNKSGCSAGALGAAVGEISAELYGAKSDTVKFASMVSGIAAAVAGQDVNVAAAAGGNAAANNFLNHDQAAQFRKDMVACQAKSGGCSEKDVTDLSNKYLDLSSQNIAAVKSCVLSGDTSCVQKLEGQAASTAEVSGILPAGYWDKENLFIAKQTNALMGSVTNSRSTTDIAQAKAVADFRQANCSGASAAVCAAKVNTAMANGQIVMTGMVAVALTGGGLVPVAADLLAATASVVVGLATEAKLIVSMGAINYCTMKPDTCTMLAEVALNVGSDSAAPSVLPVSAPGVPKGGVPMPVRTVGGAADDIVAAGGTAKAVNGAIGTASLAETQAALIQQVADLRAVLTGNARTGGNMGVAQIDIPGIQPTMAASSQIDAPTAAQQAVGFVGKVVETFPSSVVPTAGRNPYQLLRDVDSEAKILNNIAAQLGENTSATGTINLLTERAPCTSCSNVIQQFQAKYPNITINVIDNAGANIPPTKKGP